MFLVFKTLLRKEITYNSKIVVIATATSRDSVHPTLLSSHGNHVFSKSVEIPLPSLDQRGSMVCAILNKKDLSLSDEDLRYLRLGLGRVPGAGARHFFWSLDSTRRFQMKLSMVPTNGPALSVFYKPVLNLGTSAGHSV